MAGRITILRFGSTPTLWVRTPGFSTSAMCTMRRSIAGIGSSWMILPVWMHPLRGPIGDVAQLLLAPAAVVLDIHRDAVILAFLLGHDQVDDVLQAGQLLAAAANQHTQVRAAHVEPRGLAAGGDLDRARHLHQAQQLLEHALCLGQRAALLSVSSSRGLPGMKGPARAEAGPRAARAARGRGWLAEGAIASAAARIAVRASAPTAGSASCITAWPGLGASEVGQLLARRLAAVGGLIGAVERPRRAWVPHGRAPSARRASGPCRGPSPRPRPRTSARPGCVPPRLPRQGCRGSPGTGSRCPARTGPRCTPSWRCGSPLRRSCR